MSHSASTLKYSTIRTYLHGIATTQVEMGYATPLVAESLIWRMLKGIKRTQGEKVVKVRLPITTTILCKLEQHQVLTTEAGRCLRAAMWFGTTGLLRSGEFAWRNSESLVLLRSALTFHTANEHELDNATRRSAVYMKLKLAKSKTDPFRAGVNVVIANGHALAAMHDYLDARSDSSEEPLFKSTGAGGPGRALTVEELVRHTQSLLRAAKVLDPQLYLGHSFRKGGATSLHEAGEPDSLIKTMGRWRSFAFATYVSTSLPLLIKAGQQMTAARVVKRSVTFDPKKVIDWD